MVAFRSKQRRAMPIPAGANQSRHPGEHGKLGLEAWLPATGGRLRAGKRGLLPCETRETGCERNGGSQQSTELQPPLTDQCREGKATGLAQRGGQLWKDVMLVVICFCGALGLVEEDMRPWRFLNLVNLGKWCLGCRYWVMEIHDPVLVMGN